MLSIGYQNKFFKNSKKPLIFPNIEIHITDFHYVILKISCSIKEFVTVFFIIIIVRSAYS